MARSRRRLKKKIFRTFILLLFLVAIVGSAFYFKDYYKNNNKDSITTTIKEKAKKVVKEKWPKEETISLIATGDGLIHNSLAYYAKKGEIYDFTPYLTEIKDIVDDYDIAYYNQETAVGKINGQYTFFPTFTVPTEYPDAMLDAGFNLVSLASNHSYDKGETGVKNSVDYWNTKKDQAIFNGIALSDEERNNYQIGEKKGITYAMLSYTYGLNGFNLPSGKSYLVNVFNKDIAQKDIEALRDKVDLLIVAMHWGVEYQLSPNETQKEQASWLASQGVDLVIGNHPHCLQPIEWIDDTLVIYSLGNFISNQGILSYGTYGYGNAIKGQIGAFAEMDITKTTNEDQTSSIKIDNLKVDLLYTYRNSKTPTYKVLPFSKINDEYLANFPNVYDDYYNLTDYQKVYESYKEIIQKYDQAINVLPTAQ